MDPDEEVRWAWETPAEQHLLGLRTWRQLWARKDAWNIRKHPQQAKNKEIRQRIFAQLGFFLRCPVDAVGNWWSSDFLRVWPFWTLAYRGQCTHIYILWLRSVSSLNQEPDIHTRTHENSVFEETSKTRSTSTKVWNTGISILQILHVIFSFLHKPIGSSMIRRLVRAGVMSAYSRFCGRI